MSKPLQQTIETIDLKTKLQIYLLRKIKELNTETSLNKIYKFLCTIEYIIDANNPKSINENLIFEDFKLEFTVYSSESIKHEFKKSFYSICLNEILANINLNNLNNKNKLNEELDKEAYSANMQSIKNSILNIISSINYSDSFNIIYEFCVSLKPSQHRDFCFYLMKQFLSKHLIKELFIEKAYLLKENTIKSNIIEDVLIQKLFNLPDKLANCSNNSSNSIFLPNVYFKIISSDLWLCMKHIYFRIKQEKCNFEKSLVDSVGFFALIYGKLSFFGYSDILFNSLLMNLIKNCFQDQLWQQISHTFFNKIPCKYLENSLLNLVKNCSCYEDVSILFGDLILYNSDVKYLLTEKFIFLKILNKEIAIQNLIGYLYSSESRRSVYYQVFKSLLITWSNQTSIINTSYEQHFYLTKCILVCVSFMDTNDKDVLAEELMKLLLVGVEKHLHSPIDSVRTLGMVVGENLMNDLNRYESADPDQNKKLKFDYKETRDTMLLQSLRKKVETESCYKKKNNEIDDDLISNLELISMDYKNNGKEKEKTVIENDNLNIKITINEEDSDDDLIPYDTSNDLPLSKTKQPAYLRDCLDALIYSEDPEKIEVSLKSVEKLCDNHHYELEEICVELLKVLLHKSNAYGMENFEDIRMDAMISVTVHYPKESAQYLTSQFYDPGYSLTQRTDILHVLVMSIQKLSNPNEDPIFDKRVFAYQNQNLTNLIAFSKNYDSNTSTNDWKEVVKKRIEAKTKVKKTAKSATTKIKENKYSDVYGYFFFPLLRPYDKNQVHLNILQQDFMILGKLIFSLGVIMYSSVNTTVLDNMITAFVDFLWAIRNHVEPFVRKSILFSFSLIIMVIPSNLLFSTLNNYFIELKFWLENIMINDSNKECQMRASDCLNLLSQRVKTQLINH